MIDVTLIPILQDNYSFYLVDKISGINAVIDPGETNGIHEFLKENGIDKLDYIINTHHHWDHIGGNKGLKKLYGSTVFGAKADKDRIPAIDVEMEENDTIDFGEEKAIIIETHGHTSGHICIYFPETNMVFVGDTLFSMGCGKLFEGTPKEMFNSINKIKKLPDDCMIYCAHEYTLENSKFCLDVMPENDDIKKRIDDVKRLRENHIPTIPISLETEKKTNVFLMADNWEEFANYREKRNSV